MQLLIRCVAVPIFNDMISKNIFTFLKGIARNNNKAWLDANRSLYNEAKDDFIGEVDAILKGICCFDASFAGLQPRDCIFRLNRDVRFSKEKHPYKINFAAYFNPAGKKGAGAGYYLHVEPGKSFAAAGLWQPPADHLAQIRQEIDYNAAEWKSIITHKKFVGAFNNGFGKSETLQRPPKGYDAHNEMIEYIKMKSFVVSNAWSDAELQDKKFTSMLVQTFAAARPFIDFINRSMH